ncbi:hypothetical protein FOL47_007310, partial [Perkinsus chesapeaki]
HGQSRNLGGLIDEGILDRSLLPEVIEWGTGSLQLQLAELPERDEETDCPGGTSTQSGGPIIARIHNATLPSIPEQDGWTYHTYRNGTPTVGPSRFCTALICEMLRAGGVLGDHRVSCTEFNQWDIYSMDIFNTTTQQLTGGYVIDLSKPPALRLTQKPVTDHMAETCASVITLTGMPTITNNVFLDVICIYDIQRHFAAIGWWLDDSRGQSDPVEK